MTVIARMVGGLGNQLFIYAAARRMSLKNNVALKLDVYSGFRYDSLYRRKYLLDQFHVHAQQASGEECYLSSWGRVRRHLEKRFNAVVPFERRTYLIEEKNEFNPRILDFQVKGRVYLEGYWQSEKYFKDISDIIRKDFVPKIGFDEATLSESEMIKSKISVAVGVRRFQEEPRAYRSLLGMEYYRKAADQMAQDVPGAHFFIFSEEPEWIKANFTIPYPWTLISHKAGDENAFKNLWLMSLCRHFIVSQSTYQWWGAWLSPNLEKKIIAPSRNLAKAGKDFFPERWRKIE